MPIPALAVAAAPIVAQGVGALLGRKRKKGSNYRALADRYLGMRPEGYVTAADKAASERTRSRLAGAAGEAAKGRRTHSMRRLVARGLGGSPAAEAAMLKIDQDEALARQGAGESAAAQEYDAYSGNRRYMQDMVGRAFGVEAGGIAQDQARDDARQATFYNSLLETAPFLAAYFGQSAAQPYGANSGIPTSYQPSVLRNVRRLG